MIELSFAFVWWHLALAILGLAWVLISLWVGVHAGWKMALLWPILLLIGVRAQ